MPRLEPAGLTELDRAWAWHPYAPIAWIIHPLMVESASGVRPRWPGRTSGLLSWWVPSAEDLAGLDRVVPPPARG